MPRADGAARADWALRIDRWFDGIVRGGRDQEIDGVRGDGVAHTRAVQIATRVSGDGADVGLWATLCGWWWVR